MTTEPEGTRAIAVSRRGRSMRGARGRGQAGMTLIEMMVATLLAGIILAAGAAALIAATKGLDLARQNRAAGDLFTRTIERARAAEYANLAVRLDPAALAADPRLTLSGGTYLLDPDGPGPGAAEPLVVSAAGAVTLREVVVHDAARYTVTSYVTRPAGAGEGYRRLVTWVSWRRGDRALERQAATLVSAGRPQPTGPALTMGTDAAFTVNAGAALALPISLTNTGVPERWNLALTVPGRSWAITWYLDADGNGLRDAGEDTVLGDTSGDGRPDTGLMTTGQSVRIVGVVNLGGGETPGTSLAAITASAATSPGITRVVRHTVTVVAQNCSGCTYQSLFAANTTSAPADTTLRGRMPLVTAAGPTTTLPNYDTDKDSTAGRTLAPGATAVTDADPTRSAVWERLMANNTTLRGEAVVRLYVGMKALDLAKTGQMRAELGHAAADGTGWTSVGGVTTPPLGFGSLFSYVEIRVPVAQVTVLKNRLLQLRLIAPTASGPLWLAYGTAQYPASLDLPVVT